MSLGIRLALLLLLCSTAVSAQSGWFPLTLPWDDDSKTTIDASDLLVDFPEQNPAEVIDARGFVRAGSDGHFYFENTRKRARFWGVNFVFNANFPPCPDEPLRSGEYPDRQVSDKLARRLAKLGVNVVRFHHMDFFGSPSGIFDPAFFPNDTQHLDAGQLKRLDYLIYQLRKNGIYVNLNLKVARHFGPGDDLAGTESFTGSLAFFQGVSHYNPRMIELQKDYARQLLTHRNPYTGKTYAEDPAVLCLEITNEDSLFGNMLNDGGLNHLPDVAGSLPQVYSRELDTLWNDWLLARYGNHERLAAAWKYNGTAVDGADKMRNGGFENGVSDWTVQQLESARQSSRAESGAGPDGSAALRVDVVSDGTNWHVQAFQNGHAIEKGMRYEVSFYARAGSAGNLTVNVMKGASPWQNFGLSKTFQVTTQWKRYSAGFQASESDGSTARPTFDLGAANNTIWIDQVEFRQSAPKEIDAGENLESGTILRPTRSQLAGYTEPRIRDLLRFYSVTDEKYFVEMRRYLKEDLSAKPLVTGTAAFWAYLGDSEVQAKMDFVDGHFYWDHPSWTGVPAWSPTGWRIRNQPLINTLEDFGILATQAVQGKPFTVSEYNYVFPNRYALEGPLLAALVGNLQDWDAVYLFDYAGSTAAFDDAFTSSFFSMAGNPVKSAQLPVASRIFLQGQNSVASENIRVDLTQDEVAQGYAQGLIAGSKFLAGKGLNARAFLQDHLRIRSFNRAEPAPIEFSMPAGSVTSSNGELLWDRVDSQATFLRVRGSSVQGAIGFLKGLSIDLGDWSFETANEGPDHLAVLLQARDGFPLRESRRMIFSVWTEHQNTGMEWNSNLTSVENRWGRAPALIRPATVDVTLRFQSPGPVRFYPLDEKGVRKEALPEQTVEGGRRFHIDTARDLTIWYEVEINDASTSASYSSPSRALFQLYSDPANSPLQIGWIDMIHGSGGQPKVTPLLEYRSGGVLTSVVRLPLAGSAHAALIPVIRDGITNTAVALLNPTGGIFDVSLRLLDQSGVPVGQSKVETLEAGKTRAFFVDEKFTFPSKFDGSLELRASVPFISFALRSTANGAGDMLFTPYPSQSSASTGPLFFTHLVTDDSYSSEIVVLNSHPQPASVRLEFFTSSGEVRSADSMDLELQTGQLRRVLLPRRSFPFSGYARLTLRSGAELPLAVGILTRWENGAPTSEVGIPATATLDADTTVAAERPLQHTGLALLNPASGPVSVELELIGSELPIGATKSVRLDLKAGEKRSFFLREVFPKLPSHFNAILQIKPSAKIAVLSMLGIYNSRGNFLLASLTENKTPSLSGGRTIVPRFVNGGGYRTILYLANPSDEKSTGQLRFFDAQGIPQAVLFR